MKRAVIFFGCAWKEISTELDALLPAFLARAFKGEW
jgi:hypothetical protein